MRDAKDIIYKKTKELNRKIRHNSCANCEELETQVQFLLSVKKDDDEYIKKLENICGIKE